MISIQFPLQKNATETISCCLLVIPWLEVYNYFAVSILLPVGWQETYLVCILKKYSARYDFVNARYRLRKADFYFS